MLRRIISDSLFALVLATPVFAGPCTERIAELEKSLTAKHEGAGPALSAPATTGSTQQQSGSPGATSSASAAVSQGDNQAMQMLQQAKQLDQQSNERGCMEMVTRIGPMVPAQK